MLESIFIGMTGLQGYQQGLRVIANNTANLNTPGFKGSSLQFADMFYSYESVGTGGHRSGQLGFGLNTYSTSLNFRQGELRQTGNDLDLAVDGHGLFVLKAEAGDLQYSRAGQFEFNTDGVLVNRTNAAKVMGVDAAGAMTDITLAGKRTNAAKATTMVSFNGNLSSTTAVQTVGGVKVLDAAGGEHELTLGFTQDSAPGSWTVKVNDGAGEVGSGTLLFMDGRPAASGSKISVMYQPKGQASMPVVLDFSGEVTSFASGDLSTLAMSTQDGFQAGTLGNVGFDTSGALTLTYSNGQTVKGDRLALGRFDALSAVGSMGDNGFEALDESAWHLGVGGDSAFGSIRSGVVELSNVDLSQEFSDLVIMQRGYQASSQVVSTANDMLQELFAMKGK
jgi:flagellar hook protein FlgE